VEGARDQSRHCGEPSGLPQFAAAPPTENCGPSADESSAQKKRIWITDVVSLIGLPRSVAGEARQVTTIEGRSDNPSGSAAGTLIVRASQFGIERSPVRFEGEGDHGSEAVGFFACG
jgi:hypothetical protein